MQRTGKTNYGGAANHAGVGYQDRVAAWLCVRILLEQEASALWGWSAGATVETIRCNSEHKVDDVLVVSSQRGTAFINVKHAVSASQSATSEFASALTQFAAQFIACQNTAENEEDHMRRELVRFVLVTSSASKPIKQDLSNVLGHIPALLPGQKIEEAAKSEAERDVLRKSRTHLQDAWQQSAGRLPTEQELVDLLGLMRIEILDVDPNGTHEREAKDRLAASVLQNAEEANLAWDVLVQTCHEWAEQGDGGTRATLQQRLLQRGIAIKAPRSFRHDLEKLREHSEQTFKLLRPFSRIEMGAQEVKIQRPVSQALREAVEHQSVVVVGEPGAGKSGVLHELVESLKQENRDVVFLAVDRLDAHSLRDLQQELGLEHGLDQVLQNWTGTQPGFLVIDALDAARSSATANAFYELLALLLTEPSRWRVVASIRQYDLRYHTKLRTLFKGQPPTHFRSNEFSFLRHLNVPRLDAAEWLQISAQVPELGSSFIAADPKLQELLRVPFNVKLMAELLGRGLAPERLTPIKTQIELLDLYWQERMGQPLEEKDAREILLTQAVKEMVENRSLRADRRRVAVATADGPVLLNLLKANILSEWQQTVGGKVNDAVLTFAHHVLFDYAVARLLLRSSSRRLVELLEEVPELVIAIRPSLVMHFEQERWQDSRQCLETIFSIIRSGKIPEIGKLIGPSVVVASASSNEDFVPLVDELASTEPARRECAEKALWHVTRALTVKGEAVDFVVGPRALNWAALLQQATAEPRSAVIYAARSVLHLLCNQPERMTEEQRVSAAQVARRVLDFAQAQTNRDLGLVISGLQLVCRTYESDLNASGTLLRLCLKQEHVLKYGHEELFRLANELERIIPVDSQFVEEVYRAAFTLMDYSNERTPMIGSRIMPMSSTRQQDFQMARYALAGKYGAFVKQASVNALRALIASLEAYPSERYSYWGIATSSEETFDFAGRAARFKTDRSEMWADGNGVGNHEEPLRMLNIFAHYLDQIGSDAAKTDERKSLLDLIVAENRTAALWRVLLQTAAKHPQTFGLEIRPLAWAFPILNGDDTSQPAGEYLKAAFSEFTEEERRQVERAILSLPELAGEEERKYAERRRNRLLGCLADDFIVSVEARTLLHTLKKTDEVPPNEPRFHPPVISHHPFTVVDSLRMDGVPVEEVANQRLIALLEPAKGFACRFANELPTLSEIQEVIPALQALHAALQEPEAESCHEQTLDLAWSYLADACASIAKSKEFDCEHADAQFIRAALAKAAEHPSPSPDSNQSLDEHAVWGSPAARIEAAEGIMQLASKPSCANEELLAIIRRLANDSAWPVRFQIATRLVELYYTAPGLMWELVESFSQTESNKAILHFFVASTLNQLAAFHADRVAQLARNIFDRVCTDEKAKETRGQCANIFAGLYLWQDQSLCRETVMMIADAPADYEIEANQIASYLRNQLNLGPIEPPNIEQEQVRQRSFNLLHRLLSVTLQQTEELESRHPNLAIDLWAEADQEKASRLAHLAYSIGMQVYFASGAYQEDNAEMRILRGAPERMRFWKEARSSLEMLAEFGYASLVHHLVETLEYLLQFDPEAVFLLLCKVVRKGKEGGYQYEPMAVDLIVRIVERVIAEYRHCLQRNEACRIALIEILDIFVAAGWPTATRLTYRMEEIFR